MRVYITILLLAIIALPGCSPSQAGSVEEDAGQSATLTALPLEAIPPTSWEAYLLLSSASAPFTYSLVHMPAACLLTSNECQGLEAVPQFPSTEFSPSSDSPFHWSPDGFRFLMFNGYSSDLLLVGVSTAEIIHTPINLNVVSDQIAWSPDGNWVAISIQSDDEYTSRIVLLDVTNDIVRELPINLAGMLYPLGWRNNRELVLFQVEYEFPNGQTDQKKVIAGLNLVELEIHDLFYKPLISDLSLRGDSLPSVSPDGSLIAISVVRDETPFLDIYTIEGRLQKTFEAYINPIWSPDSQQIAAVLQEDQGYSLYVLNPLSGEAQNLSHFASLPKLTWLPDSTGLVAASLTTDEYGNEKSVMYFISTSSGEIQKISLDDISNNKQIVLSISFRPNELP